MKNKFWLALACFIVSYIIYTLSQQIFQFYLNIYISIIISQLAFFLFPVVFSSHLLSFNFKSAFRINTLKNFHSYTYIFVLFLSLFILTHSIINIQLSLMPETVKYVMIEFSKKTDYILKELSQNNIAIAILSLGVVPAFSEELIFRGFLQKIFENKFGAHLGIVYSSIIFSLLHFNLLNLFPLFLMSLVIGKIAFYTNSIYPGMIIHFLINTTTIISKSISGKFLDANQYYQLSVEIILLFIFSLLFTVIVIKYFKRYYDYTNIKF